MGGTRIVVVQLKQLIKSALLALGGLILIILLIYFIVPRSAGTAGEGDLSRADAAAKYIPGTYSAQIVLHNNPVDVLVSVSENEITGVTLSEMPEIGEAFYPLFRPTVEFLSEEIVKAQSTDIVTTQETEFTTKVLISAINAALEKAAFQPASTTFE